MKIYITKNIISESANRYITVGVNFEDDEELDEMGIDIYDAADEAEQIAKEGGVRILNSQELKELLIDVVNQKVIGAMWASNDSEKFSFDIAITSGYRNMGLSHMLIKSAIDEYEYQKDVYGDELKMEVDVINPMLAKLLKSKYGFSVVDELGPNRVLMTV